MGGVYTYILYIMFENKGNKTGKNILKEGGVYTYIYIHYVQWIRVPLKLEKICIC